jgi:hypothetical protein
MRIFLLCFLCLLCLVSFGKSCPDGFYSHDFSPGGLVPPWVFCVPNSQTPAQWWASYQETNVIVTNQPSVPWVPQPGDLWLQIEHVDLPQVTISFHGLVAGSPYFVETSTNLLTGFWQTNSYFTAPAGVEDWTNTFKLFGLGSQTEVMVFFRLQGPRQAEASESDGAVEFSCGLMLALIIGRVFNNYDKFHY